MLADLRIRPYRPEDQAQAEALDARVAPYRPEDQAEVQAMDERARSERTLYDSSA